MSLIRFQESKQDLNGTSFLNKQKTGLRLRIDSKSILTLSIEVLR